MSNGRVDAENANIVKREDYTRALTEIIAGGFCPFCEEHLFKHHARPILHKSEFWIITENAWPYEGALFHFLLISRIHIEKTESMPSLLWIDLLKMYQKIVEENDIAGATLMIRSGDTKITGASVNHLHAHIIIGSPRSADTEPICALVGFKK